MAKTEDADTEADAWQVGLEGAADGESRSDGPEETTPPKALAVKGKKKRSAEQEETAAPKVRKLSSSSKVVSKDASTSRSELKMETDAKGTEKPTSSRKTESIPASKVKKPSRDSPSVDVQAEAAIAKDKRSKKKSELGGDLTKEELKRKKAALGSSFEKKKAKVTEGRVSGSVKEKLVGKKSKSRL